MKKVMYGVAALIIVVGVIVTLTIGLNADIVYRKNVEIDVLVGKQVDIKDIKQIAKEVFPNERLYVQQVEMFGDTFSITMANKSDDALKDSLEQFKTKVNEKYGTELKEDESITIIHNPKIRLSSLVKPYILPMVIGGVIILAYVGIRYRKLGVFKTIGIYALHVAVVEALYMSIIAITRIPVGRVIIPIGLVLYIATLATLSFVNEGKLAKVVQSESK